MILLRLFLSGANLEVALLFLGLITLEISGSFNAVAGDTGRVGRHTGVELRARVRHLKSCALNLLEVFKVLFLQEVQVIVLELKEARRDMDIQGEIRSMEMWINKLITLSC